jgi:SAM-dependent methyltransferase
MNASRKPMPHATDEDAVMPADIKEQQNRIEQVWRKRLMADPSDCIAREAYDDLHRAMRGRPGREALYTASLTRVDHAFLVALGPATRILDVGAGNGRFALAASAEHRVVAVEISTEAIAAIRALSGGRARIAACQSSALRLPFRSSSFDVVVSQDLVEHLHPDHLSQHLAEVYRVLAAGGRYLLHTPSALFGPTSFGLHLREYRLREIRQAARSAGFRPRWICLNLARLGLMGMAPSWLWPLILAWETAWEAVGKVGLRRLGGRWYAAGTPDVNLNLLKPNG